MRVLVVEDEVRLAQALQRGLRAEGFGVDLAHDGEEGLRLAREGDYDAVVLDVMLPRLSGYRVCQALRAERNWVPVLMLSAKDGEYDEADGLDVGADDYLTKPFSYVVLLARLRALVRRGARERPAVLSAGDLTLDPAAREVTRAGDQIPLTATEFALLELLMRRRGEVVSKSEILADVWDANVDTAPERGRGLRRLPAAQDRRAVRPVGGADGARRGVPARGGRRLRRCRAARRRCPAGWGCGPGSP